ncbi:MAG: hypothetical protein ACD_2C00010G0002 [uncultured bacterium (gcode 4)]|uniref:Phage holin family protein n=1 Tax=uncultured bacterium (gcode 4) TaxID=1234023 RepID=K2GIM5_9BACT|nr:MAG: hypothetical protein ACD_2C00010G0002 [uncultured bacterium (gcode 4)]
MSLLINLLISALAVLATAYILPWVVISWFWTAIIVAIVLWIINAFIRPILILLTLPINILTIWLFTLVINAILILLVSEIVPWFKVNWFWWALIFSVVLSIINGLLFTFIK